MPDTSRTTFRLWAFGDAHVGTDQKHGRESLAEGIVRSEVGGKMVWSFTKTPTYQGNPHKSITPLLHLFLLHDRTIVTPENVTLPPG